MKKIKKAIAKQLIYSLSEYTAPEIKFSQQNYNIAKIILLIDKL